MWLLVAAVFLQPRTFYLKLNIIFLPHVFAEPQEFVPLTSPALTENHRNLLANCDCENIFLDKNIYFIEMITARVRPCYGLITTQYSYEDLNIFELTIIRKHLKTFRPILRNSAKIVEY